MRGVANSGLQFAAVEIGGGEAAGGPDEGGDAGDDIGQARRAAAQGLQDLADAGAVVIGGAARQACSSESQVPGCGSSLNRSAAAGGWLARDRSRRRARPAARRGARAGRCRAPPGWRRAPLRSGLWISAGYSPFRSSPRHYAGLCRGPNRHACAGRATSAGTFGAAGYRKSCFIPPRLPSYRLGNAKETAMVRTFSSSLTG